MKFNKLISQILEEYNPHSEKNTYYPGEDFFHLNIFSDSEVTDFERVPKEWYTDWSDNPHEDKIIKYEGSNIEHALATIKDLCKQNYDYDNTSIESIINQISTKIKQFENSKGVWLVAYDESAIILAFDKDNEQNKINVQFEDDVRHILVVDVGWEAINKIYYNSIRKENDENIPVYDINDNELVFSSNDSNKAFEEFKNLLYNIYNYDAASNSYYILPRAIRDIEKLLNLKGTFKIYNYDDEILSFVVDVDMVSLRAKAIQQSLKDADTSGLEDLL
jgi:hypothetical protein